MAYLLPQLIPPLFTNFYQRYLNRVRIHRIKQEKTCHENEIC